MGRRAGGALGPSLQGERERGARNWIIKCITTRFYLILLEISTKRVQGIMDTVGIYSATKRIIHKRSRVLTHFGKGNLNENKVLTNHLRYTSKFC